MSRYGRAKSMRLNDMLGAIDWPRGFVSLQVGPERAEGDGIVGCNDLLPDKPTWDDTAALIACLDTVVTVDTAVAHLAGTMGKDVRLAMGMHGSFHWLAPRPGVSWNDRSPWYPCVRVYRQTVPGEWGDVVARIAGDLRMKEAA